MQGRPGYRGRTGLRVSVTKIEVFSFTCQLLFSMQRHTKRQQRG